jgi:hypothetical protein
MWNAECGTRNAERGVRNSECGARSAELGMRSAELNQPRSGAGPEPTASAVGKAEPQVPEPRSGGTIETQALSPLRG